MNILNILANDNYFIYNKDIAKSMGTDVAIILGLLCNKYNYYQKENKLTMLDGKEYFYCTREHIYNETGLKESCQRKAMKILEDNNILEHKKVGIPSKNYYYINQEKLLETLENLSSAKNRGLEIQNENDLSLKNDTQIIYNNTKKENTNIDNIDDVNNDIVDITKKPKKDEILKQYVECIVDYLNQTTGTKYRSNTKGTISLIKARLKEGYKVDDFYDVIDNKWKDWKGTEFEQYMRPQTLFGNKFENYLNGKIFNGRPKSMYSSKPTFDNTANHNIPKALVSMNEEEKEEFNESLAKDKVGNLMKF